MNALQQLAKSAMETADYDDVQKAKDVAMEKVRRDVDLQAALIEYAVGVLIDNEWRAGRAMRWHRAQDGDVTTEPVASFGGGTVAPVASPVLLQGMRAEIARAKERLMDYEMEPGKRLGDCVKGDILQSASRLDKQANTMQLRSKWLRGVAALLPDGTQAVRVVLREADLQRIHRRVTRQSEAA